MWESSISFCSLVVVTSVIMWNSSILLLLLLPSLLYSDLSNEPAAILGASRLGQSVRQYVLLEVFMKDFMIAVTGLNMNNKPSYLFDTCLYSKFNPVAITRLSWTDV